MIDSHFYVNNSLLFDSYCLLSGLFSQNCLTCNVIDRFCECVVAPRFDKYVIDTYILKPKINIIVG
jgi:hypothetical protein